MDAGRIRRHDPRLILLAAYSMVTGLATEVEVLRTFGEEPTLASLVRRRDELISLLRDALVPGRRADRGPAAEPGACRRRGSPGDGRHARGARCMLSTMREAHEPLRRS